MIDHPIVLTALADHLTVGSIFRLDRALGRTPPWPADIVHLVAQRMRLVRGDTSMAALRCRMKNTRRCVECGVPVRRKLRVCTSCRTDSSNPRAVCTRAQVLARASSAKVRRHIKARLGGPEAPVVARALCGRHYFFVAHVDRLFV